ncbi:MAG: hypothetical protein F4Y53_05290 [Proteobacteria bacterium]|nr:hypothetical protein [Pseudomonadota bacterium]
MNRFRSVVAACLCLAAASQVTLGAQCQNWNSEQFFERATVDAVRACLAEGANANDRDEYGITPLHRTAGLNSDAGVTIVLLEAGADPMARMNEYDWTPLHVAAMNDDNPVGVITALVRAGADPNAKAVDGLTPLHMAAGMNANPESIQTMLDVGARLDAKGSNGLTPLHMAARLNKNPAVVAALLAAGADPNARDQERRTAWDYAKHNRTLRGTEIAKQLKMHVSKASGHP